MATTDTSWGGTDILTAQVQKLQTAVDSLTAQLGNYSNDTLVGRQSYAALTDKINMYNNSIAEYKDLISKITSSTNEQLRGSAMKEQANKWYLAGSWSKKWATWAEVYKDLADAGNAGVAERTTIRWQGDTNMANAKAGLSQLYMTIAEQEAAQAAASWSGSSWGGWWSSAGSAYSQWAAAQPKTLVPDQSWITNSGNTPETNTTIPNEWSSLLGRAAAWTAWLGAAGYGWYKWYKKLPNIWTIFNIQIFIIWSIWFRTQK